MYDLDEILDWDFDVYSYQVRPQGRRCEQPEKNIISLRWWEQNWGYL